MTGLFGGIDLGTPASRNEHALKRELELRRNHEPASGFGKVYTTGADLLLTHGQFFEGRELPEEYLPLRGPMGACFWNAVSAAEQDPSLRYFEGLTGTGGGKFRAHAWCIAPDGGVLELTYPDEMVGGTDYETNMPILPQAHWFYCGVEIQPELFRRVEFMPMLGRDRAEMLQPNRRKHPDNPWIAITGADTTPPSELPLLDVKYDPNRTSFP